MSRNLLAEETSPYLLQHRSNPVNWRPWGDDAFADARRADKPVLLSVGYSACHWCHVMAHESFEDDAIAALMNELFVCIKVDREERPDVDVVYQHALAMLGEQGGWPLTMFLTPDAEPFWGGTYFPPEPRYGRAGFPDILRRVAELHKTNQSAVRHNADAIREALNRPLTAAGDPDHDTDAFTRTSLNHAAEHAFSMVDTTNGGTHGAPKFPQPAFFRFLWRAHLRTATPACGSAVTTTLDAICQGGIYDHVGGGFARYSTDAGWFVPHFEKMLYDNAQLIDLMAEVWRTTQSPLYAARVRETIAWALRDMRVSLHPQDDAPETPFAFAAAFDADSEGVEGLYYLWSEGQLDEALGPDAALFKSTYGTVPGGNWEGANILKRAPSADMTDETTEAHLANSRKSLLQLRNGRIPPMRDDKVLADWNGLMITALANAGVTFDEPDWTVQARRVFDFIVSEMTVEGRLRHTWRLGRARHPATLDDYANMSRAALALFEATGENDYLTHAEQWTAILDKHYRDDTGGGYFLNADDANDLITRPKMIADNATPSGNGVLLEVLARLFLITGKDAYREDAEALAGAFPVSAPEHRISMPGLCQGFEVLDSALQIVIVGPDGDPATDALLRAAHGFAPPFGVFSRISPETDAPPGHPGHGKGLAQGRPAAYICQGATCAPPITEPQALRDRLSSL
ncbi:MAG: thioredoxin domain-containing protein [Rhodospirillales bacterium]|nr:thioredoxin domain-containing protein [Rhodospirillales bacterium]